MVNAWVVDARNPRSVFHVTLRGSSFRWRETTLSSVSPVTVTVCLPFPSRAVCDPGAPRGPRSTSCVQRPRSRSNRDRTLPHGLPADFRRRTCIQRCDRIVERECNLKRTKHGCKSFGQCSHLYTANNSRPNTAAKCRASARCSSCTGGVAAPRNSRSEVTRLSRMPHGTIASK